MDAPSSDSMALWQGREGAGRKSIIRDKNPPKIPKEVHSREEISKVVERVGLEGTSGLGWQGLVWAPNTPHKQGHFPPVQGVFLGLLPLPTLPTERGAHNVAVGCLSQQAPEGDDGGHAGTVKEQEGRQALQAQTVPEVTPEPRRLALHVQDQPPKEPAGREGTPRCSLGEHLRFPLGRKCPHLEVFAPAPKPGNPIVMMLELGPPAQVCPLPRSPTFPDLLPAQTSHLPRSPTFPDLTPAQMSPLPSPRWQRGALSLNQVTPEASGRCLLRFWGQNRRRPQTRRALTSQSAPVQDRCVSPVCCGKNSHPELPASSSFPVSTEFSSKLAFFRYFTNHQLVVLLAWVWLCQTGNSKFSRIQGVVLPVPLEAPTWEGTFLGGSIRMDGSHSPGGNTVT